MTESLTLLDACAAINFYATRHMEGVLAAIPGTVAIADIVAGESQFVRRGGSGDDADEREPVLLQPYIATGLLTVVSSDDESELLTFLDFLFDVDEGEAMTAALAMHRRATVITDDRKAQRLREVQNIPVRSTLAVLRSYCDQIAAPEHVVREILVGLRVRARYEPRRDHPHRAWWEAAFDG